MLLLRTAGAPLYDHVVPRFLKHLHRGAKICAPTALHQLLTVIRWLMLFLGYRSEITDLLKHSNLKFL